MINDSPIFQQSVSVLSVTEISNQIKGLLEKQFGTVQVKGEISGLKVAASGHGYFSLKDEKSVLNAVCWRYVLSNINFKLEEGMEVIIKGKITSYAGQSKYQISVESLEPSGVGAFIKILNERKAKLEKEGLFSPQHKKSLPFLPRKIGVVTSLSGAVIRDIIHRISDRRPTEILIWPVSVQGSTSAQEVAAAIRGFDQMIDGRPDLLIVARGGGSIEDLWSFNEELVVRAAFECTIPLISAIGHETDYSLLDLVADRRAPTPTAAAEFAVPVAADLDFTLNNLKTRLLNNLRSMLKYHKQRLNIARNITSQMVSNLRFKQQRLDDFAIRLKDPSNLLQSKHIMLARFPLSRFNIKSKIQYKRLQHASITNSLKKMKNILLEPFQKKLSFMEINLKTMDYRNILNKGYAMIKNSQGEILSKTSKISKGEKLKLVMQDGTIDISS